MQIHKKYTYNIVYGFKDKKEGYAFWVYCEMRDKDEEPELVHQSETIYDDPYEARQAAQEYMDLLRSKLKGDLND